MDDSYLQDAFFSSNEGFSFPKESAIEDSFECLIFIPFSENVKSGKITRVQQLEAARIAFQSYCEDIIGDYIWHHEKFSLHTVPPKSNSTSQLENSYIKGSIKFGENMTDEWVTVFALFELSKKYKDIIFRMTDSDGQFLLIEAADAIPEWLEPENSENRVFVKNGRVHIVCNRPNHNISLAEGLRFMIVQQPPTLANGAIQALLQSKLKQIPQLKAESLHTVRIILPTDLARLLEVEPALIAAGSRAFCGRDPLEAQKVCRSMRRLDPRSHTAVMVRMTRWMYAELSHQQFVPPAVFRPMLPAEETLGKYYKEHAQEHPDIRAASLGVKLSCGFELLYQQGLKEMMKGSVKRNQRLSDIAPSLSRQQLDEALHAEGFEDTAELVKRYMHQIESNDGRVESELEASTLVVHLLDSVIALEGPLANPLKSETIVPDDSEDWLNVSPQEVEDILQEKISGVQQRPVEPRPEPRGNAERSIDVELDELKSAKELEEIAKTLQRFVEEASSLDGADVQNIMPGNGKNAAGRPVSMDFDVMLKLLEGLEVGEGDDSDILDSDDENDSDDEQEQEPQEDRAAAPLSPRVSAALHHSFVNEENITIKESAVVDSDDESEPEGEEESDFYEHLMEAELAKTAMKDTFIRSKKETETRIAGDDGEDEDDEYPAPVDLDMNLVSNLLESFAWQEGMEGPASNLIRHMGLKTPLAPEK